jgi:hypothetical protein
MEHHALSLCADAGPTSGGSPRLLLTRVMAISVGSAKRCVGRSLTRIDSARKPFHAPARVNAAHARSLIKSNPSTGRSVGRSNP